MKFTCLFIVAAAMASLVMAVPLAMASDPIDHVKTNADGSKTPPILLFGREEEGGYNVPVEVTVDGYTVSNKDGNYMYMEFDPTVGSMVSSGLQAGTDNPETDKSKTTGNTLDKHEHEKKANGKTGNVAAHLRRLIANIEEVNEIPNEHSYMNRRKDMVILTKKPIDFGRAASYGMACGGAIVLAKNVSVHGNIVTTGAFNTGDGSMLFGDIDAVGAVGLGPNANFNGTVISQGAVSIGGMNRLPSGIFTGDIYSTGVIMVGQNAKLIGNIYACSVYSPDVLSSITGQVLQGGSALPVPTSNDTAVSSDIYKVYSNLISQPGGKELDESMNNTVLLTGTYDHASAWEFAGGRKLTFNGTSSDIWIIRVVGAVAFAGDIVLLGGALPSNIHRAVSRAFSIGGGLNFYGNIVSMESISIGIGTSLHGLMYTPAGACNLGDGVRLTKF